MFKKTLTAVGIAALTGAGAATVLPDAKAAGLNATSDIIELAECAPKAKKAKGCNPCQAKGCNPCAAKGKGCNPCNPCAAKKK